MSLKFRSSEHSFNAIFTAVSKDFFDYIFTI